MLTKNLQPIIILQKKYIRIFAGTYSLDLDMLLALNQCLLTFDGLYTI